MDGVNDFAINQDAFDLAIVIQLTNARINQSLGLFQLQRGLVDIPSMSNTVDPGPNDQTS